MPESATLPPPATCVTAKIAQVGPALKFQSRTERPRGLGWPGSVRGGRSEMVGRGGGVSAGRAAGGRRAPGEARRTEAEAKAPSPAEAGPTSRAGHFGCRLAEGDTTLPQNSL